MSYYIPWLGWTGMPEEDKAKETKTEDPKPEEEVKTGETEKESEEVKKDATDKNNESTAGKVEGEVRSEKGAGASDGRSSDTSSGGNNAGESKDASGNTASVPDPENIHQHRATGISLAGHHGGPRNQAGGRTYGTGLPPFLRKRKGDQPTPEG